MRERRQTLLPSVLALTFVTLLVTPLAAIAASGLPATITMRPEAAGPGAHVEVVGLDFPAGQPVALQLTTTAGPVHLATATAEQGGYFRQAVILPADVAPGFWELRATGTDDAVAVHIFEAGEASPAIVNPVAQTVGPVSSGPAPFNTDLIVVLVFVLLIAAIGGSAAFVWYQLHRVDEDPGMGRGDDPIWGGAHSDT